MEDLNRRRKNHYISEEEWGITLQLVYTAVFDAQDTGGRMSWSQRVRMMTATNIRQAVGATWVFGSSYPTFHESVGLRHSDGRTQITRIFPDFEWCPGSTDVGYDATLFDGIPLAVTNVVQVPYLNIEVVSFDREVAVNSGGEERMKYRNRIVSGKVRFKASTRKKGLEAYAWRNTTLGTTSLDQEVWDIGAVNGVLVIDGTVRIGNERNSEGVITFQFYVAGWEELQTTVRVWEDNLQRTRRPIHELVWGGRAANNTLSRLLGYQIASSRRKHGSRAKKRPPEATGASALHGHRAKTRKRTARGEEPRTTPADPSRVPSYKIQLKAATDEAVAPGSEGFSLRACESALRLQLQEADPGDSLTPLMISAMNSGRVDAANGQPAAQQGDETEPLEDEKDEKDLKNDICALERQIRVLLLAIRDLQSGAEAWADVSGPWLPLLKIWIEEGGPSIDWTPPSAGDVKEGFCPFQWVPGLHFSGEQANQTHSQAGSFVGTTKHSSGQIRH